MTGLSALARAPILRPPSETLQQARVRPAVELQVLPGDEAGVGAAQEGTGGAELLRAAQAARSRTGAEDMTLAQKEKLMFDLVEATMTEINGELERSIRQFLGRFVRD